MGEVPLHGGNTPDLLSPFKKRLVQGESVHAEREPEICSGQLDFSRSSHINEHLKVQRQNNSSQTSSLPSSGPTERDQAHRGVCCQAEFIPTHENSCLSFLTSQQSAEFYYLSQIQHNFYIKNPDGPYDEGKQQQKIPVQTGAGTDEGICGKLVRQQ